MEQQSKKTVYIELFRHHVTIVRKYSPTKKNNHIGNLKKLFSRKKKELEAEDDKGKKKIVIDYVYWEKLKFISGTNSIKKTLYKVIDEAEAKAKAKRKLDVINNEKE
ncbi:hypothetical protein F0D70_12750 [Vibrio cholerae]|nr:hypothetical protein [Vibrio cholerae]TQQ30707.1 hypothetical protein FLL66_10385 [Vibrio cholerae]